MVEDRHSQYRPVLRTKQAELEVLKNLPAEVKDRITPILEVTNAQRDRVTGARGPIEQHLTVRTAKIAKAWATERPIMIDVPYLEKGALLKDGSSPASIVFAGAADEGVNVIPVCGLDRDDAYVAATHASSRAAGAGVAVRLRDADLADPKRLDYDLRVLLGALAIKRDAVDLIIDAKHISNDELATRAAGLEAILKTLPSKNAWRSVTLVSGAMPSSLSDLRGRRMRHITRSDWALWRAVTASSSVGRTIHFGDYAIDSPTPFDPENPRTIQVSASIRYTTGDHWLIIKGTSTKKDGWEQTQDLCQALVERPEFMGATYSTGDSYIAKRAKGTVSCGNPTTWRRVGVSHHVTLIVNQLAMHGGA